MESADEVGGVFQAFEPVDEATGVVLIVIFNQCKDVGVGRDVGGGSAWTDRRGNGGRKRRDRGCRLA